MSVGYVYDLTTGDPITKYDQIELYKPKTLIKSQWWWENPYSGITKTSTLVALTTFWLARKVIKK